MSDIKDESYHIAELKPMSVSPLPLDDLLSLEAQVEAVLFATDQYMRPQEIRDLIVEEGSDVAVKQVELLISSLRRQYEERKGGFRVGVDPGLGYRLETVPAASSLMQRMFTSRPRPLSRAALETLSIIAYRQPSTRAEVEYIRGVDAGSIIKNLLDRGLIKCVGRKEDAGRPMLFGTTGEFLKVFQLEHIEDLPSLASFQTSSDITNALSSGSVDSVDVELFIGDQEENNNIDDIASFQEEVLDDGRPPDDKGVDIDSSDEESMPTVSASLEIEGPGLEGQEIKQNGSDTNSKVDVTSGNSLETRSRGFDTEWESES